MKLVRFTRAQADKATRLAIEAALLGTPGHERADFLAVRVSVRSGVCKLTGNVRSGPARCEAEQLARALPGVHEVHNWLVADDALARHVERTLLRTLRSPIDGLRVDCLLGHVELRGHAYNRLQRVTAMLVARRIAGVVEVTSSLTVHAPAEQLRAA